ncbi:unnamed protein product [Cylindrotheca closterium]|uniref:Uncharacterized protein n=1 Tax=Cylindrotheca closterium TaxID=2856 RepID=A0AAD2FLK3_9STRA|nr:unnamed protein product [Cylindrotheca closterium]
MLKDMRYFESETANKLSGADNSPSPGSKGGTRPNMGSEIKGWYQTQHGLRDQRVVPDPTWAPRSKGGRPKGTKISKVQEAFEWRQALREAHRKQAAVKQQE